MDEKKQSHEPLSDAAAGQLAETQIVLEEETKRFLAMANDPAIRPNLLDRLQELGLLSAFLEKETGTR